MHDVLGFLILFWEVTFFFETYALGFVYLGA